MMSNNLMSLVSPPQLHENRKLQYSSQITGKMLDMQNAIDEEQKSAADDVLQESGKKLSSKQDQNSEKESQSDHDGQYDMQEINISLESAD